MVNKPIKMDAHNALVLATAPVMMIAPYVLTFNVGIGLITFFLGAALMGVALSGVRSDRMLPASAIAGFDWALGMSIFAIGIVAGLAGQSIFTTVFLVGFGAAHLALTASTRYSARGA